MAAKLEGAGLATALWAVGGVLALLIQAVLRLLPRALEPVLAGEIDLWAGLAYAASILTLGFFEGYRGFQLGFSPRVVVRALHLAKHRRPLLVVFAPMMAMGLIHASRRRLIGAWGLVLGILALVLLVRMLAQPWRGAVDAGVVVGLSWGCVATVVWLIKGLRGQPPEVSADLPG